MHDADSVVEGWSLVGTRDMGVGASHTFKKPHTHLGASPLAFGGLKRGGRSLQLGLVYKTRCPQGRKWSWEVAPRLQVWVVQ